MTPDDAYPWILVVPLLAWFALCLARSLWCLRQTNHLGPGERVLDLSGRRAGR